MAFLCYNISMQTKTKLHKKHQTLEEKKRKYDFRVTIFGSARIKQNDPIYKQVFALAKKIGQHGFDVVTGGGPGLMEAANAGHELGDQGDMADSIGLIIKLPWKLKKNKHLEIKKKFNKFSSRLDNFMTLSSVVVVVPGGIGTTLEFLYTWQLTQVKHMPPIPIILIGKMWEHFIEWIKKYPIKKGLISKSELNNIFVAKNNKEAMKIILRAYEIFEKEGKSYRKNIQNYKLI